MIPEFRNFLLPSPAPIKVRELKESNPKLYEQIDLMLDNLVEVAEQYGTVTSKDRMKQNLIRVIDSGIAALGLDQYGFLTIYMWNYNKGQYLPVDGKHFDQYDMATMLRVNQIMLSVN